LGKQNFPNLEKPNILAGCKSEPIFPNKKEHMYVF